MWTHTVLEIYPKPLQGELPTEGDPADWIEKEKVYYAQGDDSVVIFHAPLWWIIWIKVKKYVEAIDSAWINHIWSKTPWWKRQSEEFWANSRKNVASDEEMKEVMGEEDYNAMKEFLGDEGGGPAPTDSESG